MVAVIGLMTTDTLYSQFSGAIFWTARTALHLKENHYSILMLKEKSFVGNYVSDSLHFSLMMITYYGCRLNKFRNVQYR
jgi:hypothetical protein